MKLLFVLMSFLVMSFAQAQEPVGCAGAYAQGIGHFLKGESVRFGRDEMIPAGKTVQDKYYKAKISKVNGRYTIDLLNKRTNQKVELVVNQVEPQLAIFSTQNLAGSQDYPPEASGPWGNMFLIFFCAN